MLRCKIASVYDLSQGNRQMHKLVNIKNRALRIRDGKYCKYAPQIKDKTMGGKISGD